MVKKIIFGKQKINKIIDLYKNKLMNLHQLGQLFGVGHDYIYRLLINEGIDTSNGKRKKALYANSKIKIWNKGLTKNIDKRVLEISKKNLGKIPSNKKKLDANKIISLYKTHKLSVMEISNIFNCSVGPIRRIMKENNISLSLKGQPKPEQQIRKMVSTRKRNDSYKSPRKNKFLEDLYGENKAKEIGNKMSMTKKRLFSLGKLQIWNKNKSYLEDKRILMGENHPSWNGGKSFEPYGLEFNNPLKNRVRNRDNQVCINCGIHREKLNRAFDIHHINYDKQCSLEQNLVSLCKNCHMLTNFNREYWTKLFQDKLSKLYNYQYSENGEIILSLKP